MLGVAVMGTGPWDADGVVAVEGLGDQQLGPDPVAGRGQHPAGLAPDPPVGPGRTDPTEVAGAEPRDTARLGAARARAMSMNWRGRPLESHEVIVELIGDHDPDGLRVRAELDRGRDPLGVRVGDAELAAVPLVQHGFHGEWNYSMQPAADQPPPTAS